jgi:NAD(P)-dependent dehydrogenase (short-subunit alcohol dehydrogenase family)
MKTTLITGANKGIGREVARQLALKGFHVFLGARNADTGHEDSGILTINDELMWKTLETNTLGPLRVTRAFVPLLVKSSAPRVINVSAAAAN